jgi:HTH-type transcriptional regulator / antitoxin HipB
LLEAQYGRAVPDAVTTPDRFGAVLRARRRALGITQQQLADAAGVSRKSVVDIERGKPNAQLHIALHLAQSLGLDVHVEPR